MELAVESEWPTGLNFSPRSNLFCFNDKIGYIYGPKRAILNLKNIMPITLDKKKELVLGLEKALKGANSVVFVKFDKLVVAKVNNLRRKLQKENVGYMVAKKTLLKRALDSQKIEGGMPEIPGQIAIAYGEDLLSPSREIFNFSKDNKENIEIVGGVFEGKYMTATEMLSIATIPPLQTLRGMFVNIINSPIQRFAVVLNAIAEKKG